MNSLMMCEFKTFCTVNKLRIDFWCVKKNPAVLTGGSMLSGRQSRQELKDMLGHQKISAKV